MKRNADDKHERGSLINMFKPNDDGTDLKYSWTHGDNVSTYDIAPELSDPTMWPNFMNICPIRAAVSGIMGYGLGLCIGVFFAAMGHDPLSMDQREHLNWKQQMRLQFKDMRRRSRQMSRQFGTIGFLYR
eukprot:UN11935